MDEFRGYATQEGLFAGDFRKKPVNIKIESLILTVDQIMMSDLQREIRYLLEGLGSVEGLIPGEAFTMSIGESSLDSNIVKIKLEFEQGDENAGGTDQLDEGDHHHGEEPDYASQPVDDRQGGVG